MEENGIVNAEETRAEGTSKLIRVLVAVLAVLGLIGAVAIVAGYLYKKFKKTIAAFNEDIVYDPLEEKDLETEAEDETIKVFKEGETQA